MRITDELRKYAEELETAASRKSEHGYSPVAMKLTAIADRIDEECVRQQEAVIDEVLGGLMKMTDENMAKNGWVRLPKDADGEYIHIGDVVYDVNESPSEKFSVTFMELCKFGWSPIDNYGGRTEPSQCRHHHESTVEDVLREMMREASCNIYADGSCEMGLTYEQFDKYAKMLELRDES